MKVIRTQEEIVNHMNDDKEMDFLGFQHSDLCDYLDFKNAKPFLVDDFVKKVESGEEKFEKSKISPLERIKDYMEFAWNKANNCRGLSADRSINHFLAWTWLIDDNFYNELKESYNNHYHYYGKPQLEMVCKHFNIDYSKYDDGVRTNTGY